MKKVLFILGFLISCIVVAQNSVRSFDGVDDYIDLGDTVGNGVRTMEMWFQPESKIDHTLSTIKYLVVREIAGINNNEFSLLFVPSSSLDVGALQFIIRDNNNTPYRVYSDSKSWNAGQWYHVAAVIDPVKGMRMYIDGLKQADTNTSTLATTTAYHSTSIGGTPKVANRYFNGKIDDVRFSSSMEYTSDFTPLCPDLKVTTNTLGLWNFNDSSNAIIAIDSSVNAYNADIYGAIGEIVEICPPVTYTNVRDFDGIDDYIDLGDTVGNGVRTMEMWFQPKSKIDHTLSNIKYLVVREIAVINNNEFSLLFVPSSSSDAGALQFIIRDNNNTPYRVYSDSKSWNAGQWYHVAAVIDPVKGMRMYIDGLKQADTNTSTLATTTAYHSTSIGGTPKVANRYFNGK